MRDKCELILDHDNYETAQQKFISWMEFFDRPSIEDYSILSC